MTKAQKERLQKDQLRQRIADVIAGASGGIISNDEIIGVIELSRAIPAFKSLWLNEAAGEKNDYLFAVHNLDQYSTVNDITELYWQHGIRP